MLIVSKFHDYYDSAVGVGGVDKTVVFNRKSQDLRSEHDVRRDLRDSDASRRAELTTHIVGFCGELFPCVELSIVFERDGFRKVTSFHYDLKSLTEELGKYSLSFHSSQFSSRRFYFSHLPHIANDTFFTNTHGFSELKELFRQKRVPVFVYTPNRDGIFLNPKLRDFGFQKKRDPFTAFQEIAGFISGVLGSEGNPMVEISDKDKITKHGFFKWSFRKEPWKHVPKK